MEKTPTCSLSKLMIDPRMARARMDLLNEALAEVDRYAGFVKEMAACPPHNEFERRNQHRAAITRGRVADTWVRRALHVGIDTVNEIFDAGALSTQRAHAALNTPTRLATLLRENVTGREELSEIVDSRWLERTLDVLERHDVVARVEGNMVELGGSTSKDGEPVSARMRIRKGFGTTARVEPPSFFAAGTANATVGSFAGQDDCHHKRDDIGPPL